MRDGFHAIVSGWMTIDDFDDLTDRIERVAKWSSVNGPLEDDEQATITFMIESQMARAMALGDFDFTINGVSVRFLCRSAADAR